MQKNKTRQNWANKKKKEACKMVSLQEYDFEL